MERNQFWIFLAIGLVVGVGLQIIKEPPKSPVKLAGFTKFETLIDEGRPVYIPTETTSKKAPKEEVAEPVLVAEAATPTPTPGAKAPDSKAISDAAKKKNDEAKKKKEEEKKKKAKEAAKKKKKKKKVIKENEEAEPEEEEAEEESPAEEVAQPAAPIAEPVAAAAATDEPKTFEEWKAYILARPDFERVSKLIRYRQAGIVSQEIFIAVVASMFSESNVEETHALAVMALGSVPSATAFIMLSEQIEDNSQAARVRKSAETYRGIYVRFENLRHLTSVIQSQESPAASEAAIKIVKQSYTRAFSNAGLNPSNGATPNTSGTVTAQKLARYYDALLTALKAAALNNPDESVRQLALSVSSELSNLISPYNT